MLVDQGLAAGYAGDLERAVRLLRKALSLLDAEREPRAVLAAKHNLSLFLHEKGDPERAVRILEEILPQYAEQGDRMNLVRLRWLEGKLALAQGRHEAAEEAFLEVRRAFVEREVPYDAALASLDLAAVFLARGRTGELRTIASEMLSIFHSLGIHREALAALALFKQAAEMERASSAWVRSLSAYFGKARTNPALRFQPPAAESA